MKSYRFGLVGKNISYSLSPQIFDYFFHTSGMNGAYSLYDLPPEDLETLLGSAAWDGLNVTIPHKTDALRFCASLSDTAKRVGAVNTLSRKLDGIIGDNTDVAGFRFALSRFQSSDIKNILIIGSGGAARAVLTALRDDLPDAQFTIASHNPATAQSMVSTHAALYVKIVSPENAAACLSDFDLIVQAAPLGSSAFPGLPLPSPFTFHPKSLIMDLIYAPRPTEFLKLAAAQGAQTMNGLPMLIAQAAQSFSLWTQCEINLDQAKRELLPQLETP